MKTQDYQNAILAIPHRHVSLGYMAIHIHHPDELAVAQTGYSVDPHGRSLTARGEGAWQESWLVIGYEDLCGDPIFIDTSSDDFPVYTAAHGEGKWDPVLIACTLQDFAKALEDVASLARGRENPVELKANPITPLERDLVLEKIREMNPIADMSLWAKWLGGYN